MRVGKMLVFFKTGGWVYVIKVVLKEYPEYQILEDDGTL